MEVQISIRDFINFHKQIESSKILVKITLDVKNMEELKALYQKVFGSYGFLHYSADSKKFSTFFEEIPGD